MKLNRSSLKLFGYGLVVSHLLFGTICVFLNYIFIYALLSGKIRKRWGGWIEAKESIPFWYWVYVAAFGAGAIFLTVFFLCVTWSEVKSLMNQRNEIRKQSRFGENQR